MYTYDIDLPSSQRVRVYKVRWAGVISASVPAKSGKDHLTTREQKKKEIWSIKSWRRTRVFAFELCKISHIIYQYFHRSLPFHQILQHIITHPLATNNLGSRSFGQDWSTVLQTTPSWQQKFGILRHAVDASRPTHPPPVKMILAAKVLAAIWWRAGHRWAGWEGAQWAAHFLFIFWNKQNQSWMAVSLSKYKLAWFSIWNGTGNSIHIHPKSLRSWR